MTISRMGDAVFSKSYIFAPVPKKGLDAYSAVWMALTLLGYEECPTADDQILLRVWLENDSNTVAQNTLLQAQKHTQGIEVLPVLPAHIDLRLTPLAAAELVARGLRQKAYIDHTRVLRELEAEYTAFMREASPEKVDHART